MKLRDFQNDFQFLVDQASKLLGGPARAVQMEWTLEQSVERHAVRLNSAGITSGKPTVWVHDARRGHQVCVGIQIFGLQIQDRELGLAKVIPPGEQLPCFWVVREDDYRDFYRFIRQQLKDARLEKVEPIMRPSERTRLWDNTIGFLRRDADQLKRFGVPQRRGVLLTGEPGNGKTMACRWLSAQCERFGLEWENVTVDDYEAARRDGTLQHLFQPERRGIVLFDDFDTALRDRLSCDNPREQITFLAELDGMNPKNGVVYLFTSNLEPDELDTAFRRPGRIDEIIQFPKPDATLRQRFILEHWHDEIVQGLDIDAIVNETDGFSFAEFEEMKKQIVLRYLDKGSLDWQAARETMSERRNLVESRRAIGFSRGDSQSVAPTTVATFREEK